MLLFNIFNIKSIIITMCNNNNNNKQFIFIYIYKHDIKESNDFALSLQSFF